MNKTIWIVGIGALLLCAPAWADQLTGTLDQDLVERAHEVQLQIKNGVASLRVRRAFFNHGAKYEEANLSIELPPSTAATGLRIRASSRWYDGELMDAQRAGELYQELTGFGPHQPRDPALLQWSSAQELSLQVFPMIPNRLSTVEYVLTPAVDYADGKYLVRYSRPQGLVANLAPVGLRVLPETPDGRVAVDGWPIAASRRVLLPRRARPSNSEGEDSSSSDLVEVTVTPPPIYTVAARLGRVVAGPQKEFLRLEVDAAPQLRPLPRNLSVVFVVDASHSIAEEGIQLQLAMVRAFLRHLPDARAEIVVVRRRAERLLNRFASPSEANDLLRSRAIAARLQPGNGSALDQGLALAAEALRGRPAPRTVLAMSDGLFRSSFEESTATAALKHLPRGTVGHVAVLGWSDHELTETRDDDHFLAPVAAAHGGVLLQIGSPRAGYAAGLSKLVLGLVRPIRIDRLEVVGLGDDAGELPDALSEGNRAAAVVELKSAPRSVRVEGRIWARPFQRRVKVDPTFSRATAARLVADEADLDQDELRQVASFGRAVSSLTSYLAIEPGVRPSKEGILRSMGSAGGTIGSGNLGTIGHGATAASGRQRDHEALFREVVKQCLAKHTPGSFWTATLTVETSRDEIVDVVLKDPPTPLRSCIVEGAWGVRLPPSYAEESGSFDLLLR